MLVLSRKKGESIIVGDNIEISIIDIQGDSIKIGVNAPKDVKIYRKEIYDQIIQENIQATQNISNLGKNLDKLKDYKK
ncbi:Carbon storage regulator [Candidatus Syntrophocurvum alkaliphilum]|uniref:Translational regulator CsrA n=1 Tax=Candidatus Syntrophocurvum alkaliphilum TaxID=2293317 RepID=A0A6I6DKC3_9FIRM|nr:carbon storage regulator CsrA [Candidatus Syntrophocurvum alkaliphilum]QGU00430.1 Carbon storage regulator [Candidatus Syntrophocurvum alkaliphilum]